ncbi:heme peroxidase [Mycena vulgaris]|nr:heme peroxidase [Mycena vulgaris]
MANISPLQAFSLGTDFAHLSRRGLPAAPDGDYDFQNQANANRSPQGHSAATNLIASIQTIKPKGPVKPDPRVITQGALLDTALHPDAVNDRNGVFMDGIALLSHLPPGSSAAKDLSDTAITLLYDTIPHPPAASLGAVHAFRQADGGGNNLQTPDLGRGGTPYARSVQGQSAIPLTSLPDPGLVFDTLMRARDRKDHPGGNSSMTFAFATLVTHSLFRTDPSDWNINATSSYLDLSLLYGINQATQDLVRDKAPGRGLLYPDTFSEERLTFLPPAASALLVILNRNHNYIADMLLKINERGRWSDPPPEDLKLLAKQDEEIFQTARLIKRGSQSCAQERAEGIVSPLMDNVFGTIKGKDGRKVERGMGNQCSAEFNVLYRWHPTLSARDQQWTEDTFRRVFGNRPLDELTLKDFGPVFGRVLSSIDPDPSKRTFGGLTRGKDGKFSDDAIAQILQDATDSPAARQWSVCTMNEFRQFLGLRRFQSFEEWNPDPEIASAAQRLYGHVDNLELYPGLHESPQVSLLMRAVLADAIALVRGDRYYTTDFTPGNLTAWGHQDCQRDPHNGGFGGERYDSSHPDPRSQNSVYGCFPFFTPTKMKDSLTAQGIAADYTFERPIATSDVKILNTFTAINYVFNDPVRFRTAYDMKGMIQIGPRLFTPSSPPQNPWQTIELGTSDSTVQKIKERSWKYDGVSVSFKRSQCGLPLKTKDNPRGLYTEQEIYEMFVTLFTYTFIGIGDSEHGFSQKWAATQAGGVIQALIARAVLEVAPQSAPNAVLKFISHVSNFFWPPSGKSWYPFLHTLAESRRPMNELVANVIGIAEMLGGYVREAMRLNPQYGGLWRDVTADAAIPTGTGHALNGCESRYSHLRKLQERTFKCTLKPLEFPNPTAVDPTRPLDSYNLNGTGFHGCPGLTYAVETITEIVKVVFSLKNVRRAPGIAGRLSGFKTTVNETETNVYLTPYGTTSPWPGSMYLVAANIPSPSPTA